MTASNFPACLDVILNSEGGFVDDPKDPGGATNLGITLATLSGWLGHTARIADVEALTPEAVAPIYLADYFNATHCGDLPNGVDLMVFDCAVNSGVGRAIRTLQGVLDTPQDGAFGPLTASRVASMTPASIIFAMAAAREAFYRSLPTFGRFGNGWLARVERTKTAALGMVK